MNTIQLILFSYQGSYKTCLHQHARVITLSICMLNRLPSLGTYQVYQHTHCVQVKSTRLCLNHVSFQNNFASTLKRTIKKLFP